MIRYAIRLCSGIRTATTQSPNYKFARLSDCHDGLQEQSISLTLTCRGLLFDMDGTLVDSTAVVEAAWGWWAKRHDIPLETVLSVLPWAPNRRDHEEFLPGQDHTAEMEEMERLRGSTGGRHSGSAGSQQVVRAVQNHPWAIVTSAWRALAEARVWPPVSRFRA